MFFPLGPNYSITTGSKTKLYLDSATVSEHCHSIKNSVEGHKGGAGKHLAVIANTSLTHLLNLAAQY